MSGFVSLKLHHVPAASPSPRPIELLDHVLKYGQNVTGRVASCAEMVREKINLHALSGRRYGLLGY